MIAILIAAFFMGAIGSLHCIGMCGPLALALPVVNDSYYGKFMAALLYNFGRTLTYAALGAVLGIIGSSFKIAGLQQGLSITVGLIIVVVLLYPKKRFVTSSNAGAQRFFAGIRNQLGTLLKKRNYQSVFFIGLVNGFLPCGLVYMALAGAIAAGSVFKSSMFMAAFGLGTIPLMWSVAFFGSFINLQTRAVIRKAYPYLMAGMAILLIIRGLGLEIPFISPGLHSNTGDKNAGGLECHEIK